MMKRIKNKDRFAKRVKTKRLLLIAFLSLFLTPYSLVLAKPTKPAAPVLTTEQEQQFTYYWYAAKQAIQEERYADAFVLMQFCEKLKPNDASTLYYLGVMHLGLEQRESALAYFERAYAAQPKEMASDDLLEQMKRIYVVKERWKDALRMQDEIDAHNEFDAYSAMTRYRIYAMWGKPKQAIQVLDRYLETDPTNLRFLLFRLEIMEQTGAKQKELYAMYKRVLELEPYNLLVLNNYAYHMATHKGDLKEAERMSAITIRQEPNNPVYLDTYGWILHLQGQDELALFYLERALQNAGKEVQAEVLQHLKEVKHEK